ncbi:prepilin-type N-terminal cleavage/methylation domain-containing protein [Planococcus sp. APC 4015]|nr:prepilin-type N-terminal cleavage/methylation domain-containing protein [Planococcus sp. APC 4015]
MELSRDHGFSLVEVIIAMFLLAVIALAVLPLTITAVRASVGNADLVAATTFANAQLAPIRDAFPQDPAETTSCAVLRARATTATPGPAGSDLVAAITVSGCPAAYPGSMNVTVTVSERGSPLVTLPTRVLVSGP